jgi:hypothetical protein
VYIKKEHPGVDNEAMDKECSENAVWLQETSYDRIGGQYHRNIHYSGKYE